MAARRLLIVMLVLLGISILGGTLLPTQRARDRTGTTASETTEETTIRDTVPRGDLLTRTIEVPAPVQKAIPVHVGDQLLLLVASKLHDDVEIPKLGLVDAVDPFAPARFDILAVDTGSYPIRLIAADRRVGRVVVKP